MDVRLIKNKSELKGTCYFEFLPGPYMGVSWNENSVFLEEETFVLIEPVFERRLDKFDHFAFTEVPRPSWTEIINDLQTLRQKLTNASTVDDIRSDIGLLFITTEASLNNDFPKHKLDLMLMIDQLIEWLTHGLTNHDVISVLGI